METIHHGDKVLAIVYKNGDWVDGLNFFTQNSFFIQASSWQYPKGKKLASHLHKIYDRAANRTHELVYVKQGRMKVLLYDEEKNLKEEFVLSEGDTAVFVNGGHGYEILEDNTQILEVKNGPFIDVDKDKEKF